MGLVNFWGSKATGRSEKTPTAKIDGKGSAEGLACRGAAVAGATFRKLELLANFIGSRNYITFADIDGRLGIHMREAIALKPELEDFMGVDIASLMNLKPPGFFIEDR